MAFAEQSPVNLMMNLPMHARQIYNTCYNVSN